MSLRELWHQLQRALNAAMIDGTLDLIRATPKSFFPSYTLSVSFASIATFDRSEIKQQQPQQQRNK